MRSKQSLKDSFEEIDGILYNQGLAYILEIICTELISYHQNDPLARYFKIEKTMKLIVRKYYWLTLQADVEAYVKACNIY